MRKTAIATIIIAITAMAAGLLACGNGQGGPGLHSAYYWSTTFKLDDGQRQFMSQHGVKRLYVRYFDVVDIGGEPQPNATVRFAQQPPRGVEVVPTVFVMPNCLGGDVADLAGKVVRRVAQISGQNGIGRVAEMQIDCDWTASTQQAFFAFMRAVRSEARKQHMGTSVTIRLHQLSQTPPPADRGVLMLYNTGDVRNLGCHKPILDIADVRPYLKRLGDYNLPLAAAYPTFRLDVLFREGEFVGIVHRKDEYPILPTDSIAVRQPTLADVMAVKRAVGREKASVNSEIIIYDISSPSYNHFNTKDYEEIFIN